MDCFVAYAPRNDGEKVEYNQQTPEGQITSDLQKSCQALKLKIFRFSRRKISGTSIAISRNVCGEIAKLCFSVIASEAKQSTLPREKNGLLRRKSSSL